MNKKDIEENSRDAMNKMSLSHIMKILIVSIN